MDEAIESKQLREIILRLESRIEIVLQENEALHHRLDAMIAHAQALEAELREWEAQGPAPSLVAASQVYQSRITRLEDELRQLLEAGGEA